MASSSSKPDFQEKYAQKINVTISTSTERTKFARGDRKTAVSNSVAGRGAPALADAEYRTDDQEDGNLVLPIGGEMEEVAGDDAVGEDETRDDKRYRAHNFNVGIDRGQNPPERSGGVLGGRRLASGPDIVEAVYHFYIPAARCLRKRGCLRRA